jgi:hypothetical protein
MDELSCFDELPEKIRGNLFIIILEHQKRTRYSQIKKAMYLQRKL